MERYEFESVNLPGFFVRHSSFAGELTRKGGPVADFSFTMFSRGTGREIGLRSTNFPDRYLRHRSFRVLLEGPGDPNPDLFVADSSFVVVLPGLTGVDGSVSFRSVNFGDRYLRHRDFHLWVEGPGSDPALFRADATFRHRPAAVTIDEGTELNPVDG